MARSGFLLRKHQSPKFYSTAKFVDLLEGRSGLHLLFAAQSGKGTETDNHPCLSSTYSYDMYAATIPGRPSSQYQHLRPMRQASLQSLPLES
jgi:hypothetical protein